MITQDRTMDAEKHFFVIYLINVKIFFKINRKDYNSF